MSRCLVLPRLARVSVLAAMGLLFTSSCGSTGSPPPTVVVVDLRTPAAGEPLAPAKAAAPEPGDYAIYPGVSVPEAWVDCRTEDDCAIVEAGCCDHCNGGAIASVNAAFAVQAKALLPKLGCDKPCSDNPCDVAQAHQLVCMTRACLFDDLEPEVSERIWGGEAADDDDAIRIDGVVKSAP